MTSLLEFGLPFFNVTWTPKSSGSRYPDPALSGDGGMYSTVADFQAFWPAFLDGRVVRAAHVAEMTRPRSDVPAECKRYGLGFWLHATRDAVMLEGFDAGVSCKTVHDRATGITHTVIANSSYGAWPITRRLDELLGLE